MFKVGDKVKTKDCYNDIESFKGVINRIIHRTDCSYCGKNKLRYEVQNLCGDTRWYCECCLEYDTDCRFKVGDRVKTTKEWHREPFSGTVVWCLFPGVVVKNKCDTEVFHFSDLEYDTCSDTKVGMKYIDGDVRIFCYKKQLLEKNTKILELCEEKRQANNDFKYILADTYNRIKYLERENRDLQDKINNYEHSVKAGLDTCLFTFGIGLGIGMFIIYVIMNL